MSYWILADAVVLVHLGFALFVIAGGALLFRWPRLAVLHLPALAWGVLVECMHWICPLTYLENWLRLQAGVPPYSGDFIDHYLIPLLYPSGLTPAIQMFLGIAVMLLNAGVYVCWWFRHRSRSTPPG